MDGIWRDVQYGLRRLGARPGFTLVTVLTLGLGVGASTAIFSAVNALLLRPLPVADVDRLVFGMALRQGFDPFGTSLLDYALYRRQARSLVASGLGTPQPFELHGRGEPERLRGAAVTASYLTTVGVQPLLGRSFAPAEDRPGGPAVAMLGHGLWQRRFGSDRGIIGRTLALGSRSYEVVGVLPPGFDMPYSAEVWVPLQVSIDALPLDQRAAFGYELVARLAPGATWRDASRELARLAKRLEAEHPQIRRGWSYGVVPLRRQLLADLEGRTQRSLLALVVAVGFLLLICCGNVACLLVARGLSRQGEMATRLALGAGRRRLMRQLLVESLLLALLGGTVGVLLACGLQPVLRALDPIQAAGLGAYLTDFRLDARVLLFALLVTLLDGVLFGLLPALQATRSTSLLPAIAGQGPRAAGGGTRRLLTPLVVGEIAVAATLLVGGGLMVQSFQRLQGLDLGFRPDGLLTAELPLDSGRYPGQAEQVGFMERVLARVRAVPGVRGAGMTLNVPMQRGVTLDSVFAVEGRPPAPPDQVPITAHRLVSPGYMETLGLRLLAGRFLDAGD
ncbi:MAG TPA: ABC transporter permease, partial [Thermoanaerobaculia bacterium]|nr:ABC transporter permease [Thermoanaerobaculia bacterium]